MCYGMCDSGTDRRHGIDGHCAGDARRPRAADSHCHGGGHD